MHVFRSVSRSSRNEVGRLETLVSVPSVSTSNTHFAYSRDSKIHIISWVMTSQQGDEIRFEYLYPDSMTAEVPVSLSRRLHSRSGTIKSGTFQPIPRVHCLMHRASFNGDSVDLFSKEHKGLSAPIQRLRIYTGRVRWEKCVYCST